LRRTRRTDGCHGAAVSPITPFPGELVGRGSANGRVQAPVLHACDGLMRMPFQPAIAPGVRRAPPTMGRAPSAVDRRGRDARLSQRACLTVFLCQPAVIRRTGHLLQIRQQRNHDAPRMGPNRQDVLAETPTASHGPIPRRAAVAAQASRRPTDLAGYARSSRPSPTPRRRGRLEPPQASGACGRAFA
jgi:hypothetical protein